MYWALALGSCFGGNLTPVGAAANLVVINIAEKNNHEISWGALSQMGAPYGIWFAPAVYRFISVYLSICIIRFKPGEKHNAFRICQRWADPFFHSCYSVGYNYNWGIDPEAYTRGEL